jgi:hypothetical protein
VGVITGLCRQALAVTSGFTALVIVHTGKIKTQASGNRTGGEDAVRFEKTGVKYFFLPMNFNAIVQSVDEHAGVFLETFWFLEPKRSSSVGWRVGPGQMLIKLFTLQA